jgi:prevent-host-death family protein
LKVVNVHEAKTHLSRLLRRVARGEPVIIARGGKPVARLVPVEAGVTERRLGIDEGRGRIADDFDETPASVIAEFEGR